MVFNGEKIDPVPSDQIQHYERVHNKLAQVIAGAELFFKTFNQSSCFS